MVKKYTTFDSQLGESVVLTDKAKLSLYKKSQNSGISVDILEEVYRRGYRCWSDIFGGTQDSFAFDRVNSFISGGFATQLDEDLMEKRGLWDNIHAKRARIKSGSGEHMRKPGSKGAPTDAALKASQNEDADPCWSNYKQVGMKMKNGKQVPNCVPVKEDQELNKPVMTPGQLAKKHGKTIAIIKKALNKGTKVEGEHTTDKDEARRIASAHIGEKPDYYTKLDKAGLEEKVTQEPHSKNKKKSASRFDASDELVSIYKHDTPGQVEEDWQDSKYKSPSGGLTKAGVMAFRREHPGSKLQTAVTTKPSKLKPGSKAANRRKSFCARMGGMKKRLTSAKTANDPDSRINKALRKWNCEETINELSVPAGTTGKRTNVSTPMVAIRMASGKIEKHPPGKSGSSGGGGDEE